MRLTVLCNYVCRVWCGRANVTKVVSVSCFTEPVFYFGDVEYSVDESAGSVEVRVWRSGTDLSQASSVTVTSQKTDPPSADGEQFPTMILFDYSTIFNFLGQNTLKSKYFTSVEAVWLNVLFSWRYCYIVGKFTLFPILRKGTPGLQIES